MMHISGMTLDGRGWGIPMPPLSIELADGGNEFAFDERVTVFIGPNASGKSSLIRWLQKRLSPSPRGGLTVKNWPEEGHTTRVPLGISIRFCLEDSEPELKPPRIPTIAIPATRVGISATQATSLRSGQALLTPESHQTDTEETSETAPLMLTGIIGEVLHAEQVQHATEALIKLAEHKAQNDVHDNFDRRLATAKLLSQQKMDELCEQIAEEIKSIEETTAAKKAAEAGMLLSTDIWLEWLSHFPDSQALAAKFGVSNEQFCLAIKRLDEEHSHRIYTAMIYQASYAIDIDDEDAFMYSSNVTSKAFANFHKAIKLSQICAKHICDGILSDSRPSHISYQIEDDIQGIARDRTHTVQDVNIGVTPFITWQEDEFGYPVGRATRQLAYELSAGTEMTIWWVRLVALNMLFHADFKFGWEKRPAILLIDEIENHLHPTWQRRVIPALLKYFPGLQIFATTHSPFVIAGLKAGQVHLLNRDTNGVVTASTNTEDIIGWTADEILRVFMGVDDPTDDATASAARELRQLRDAGPHPDEREEERRQARMQELREQVDRSLLAGGPRAAEDERFAENLAGILERYRQSRDLNQENG